MDVTMQGTGQFGSNTDVTAQGSRLFGAPDRSKILGESEETNTTKDSSEFSRQPGPFTTQGTGLFGVPDRSRLFRESKETNAPEESNGSIRHQPLVFQIGNEFVQGSSNFTLPLLSLQVPHLSPHPGHGQDNLVQWKYPENLPTGERAPETNSDLFQHLLDVEKAKLVSRYENEIKRLADEVEAKKEQCEVLQHESVRQAKQRREQTARATEMEEIIHTALRKDRIIDYPIVTKLIDLNLDILALIKNHLVYHSESPPHPGASPELALLTMRGKIASVIFEKFFSADAMPFGFGDHLLEKNPLRMFEVALRKNQCDGMYLLENLEIAGAFDQMETNRDLESIIKQWRVTTVKTCKLLNQDSAEYAAAISDQIWNEGLYLNLKQIWTGDMSASMVASMAARKDLEKLCKIAADIAINLRSSSIDYEWEQDTSRLSSLKVNDEDHSIIGTQGPDIYGEPNYEIAYIMFGGLIRGDTATGLLEHGRTRLSKSDVVIKSLES